MPRDVQDFQREVAAGQHVPLAHRGFDVGAGPGKTVETELEGGTTGIIIDCRGRQPFVIPESPAERVEWLTRWTGELNAYPDQEN